MSTLRTYGLVMAGLAVLLAGCGGVRQAAQRQKRMNDIKEIGLTYHNFVDAENKAPTGPADLVTYLQKFGGSASAAATLSDGSFTFIYGVKPLDMTAGASQTVVGYDSAAPTSGGIVLFGDGSVRLVSAQEFQGLTKAQPKAK